MCHRNILRGEQPVVFLHGGERHIVCELCVPRAVHSGWIREGADAVQGRSLRPWGRRAGPSLRERLLRPRDEPELLVPEDGEGLLEGIDEPPFDYVEPPAPRTEMDPFEAPVVYRKDRAVRGIPTNAEMKMVRAIELFNQSSHARMIAGVARTLGAPLISVRPSAIEGSIVGIVVGWEISWYRFEVDLADEASGVREVGKGYVLDELEDAEREPNAVADELGVLHPALQSG
ncbi:unannotated protein [freshwater metagenome]|uniref:Unannotated protein n=1 Tax=freshwater metagenome TaxID=449393 RepID=A0A6J7J8U6_9ZZZZ